MGADNTSTEEASPHQGKRGCALSSEALPTETKPRLLKDSLAVACCIIVGGFHVTRRARGSVSMCEWARVSREKARGMMERGIHLHLSICKPPNGFSSRPLHHELQRTIFQSRSCKRSPSWLKFFKLVYVWEWQGRGKAVSQRFCIHMHGFGLPTPHADPHISINNCLWHYSAHNDYHRGPLYWCRKCKQMVASHSTSKR